MYLLNNDFTTSLIYIVIVIRSLIYIDKDKFKSNIIPFIIILVQILIGCITLQETSQIFSIMISCYSSWYLWFYKNTQKLRIGNVVANIAWAIYNIYGGLYIILIMRGITIASNIVAYFRRKNELEKSKVKR